jgi:lysophospholipase L1-like esterase
MQNLPRTLRTSGKLTLGLATAAVLLVLLEMALRVLWHLAGSSPSQGTVLVQNRFAPQAQAELPTWFWNAMAPAQRSNVVGNAMAYPDPEFIFRVRPNPTGAPVYGFSGINALGFRTAHLDGGSPADRQANGLRILHLGDSCAWGWGIRRFEQTIDPEVERRLASEGIASQVINLAQPGFTTTQGRKLFDQWLPRLRPDFVILQYGWNDRRNSRGFTDRQVMNFLPIVNSWPAKALMKTALYRTFAWASASLTPAPPNPAFGDRDLDPVVDNQRMRVPLKESIANYREMIDRAKGVGARVLIILPPFRPSVSGLGPRIRDFNREVEASFRDVATFIDLPAMRPPTADLDAYFDTDGIHPNLRGVRYIAAALSAAIASQARSSGLSVASSQP